MIFYPGRFRRFALSPFLAIFLIVAADSIAKGQGLTEATVHIDRAVVAYEEQNYPAALNELQVALQLEPQNIEALYYQGIVYLALNRAADAQASLEKARLLRPADDDIAFQSLWG